MSLNGVLNNSTYFICLTIVLLPDSPAPEMQNKHYLWHSNIFKTLDKQFCSFNKLLYKLLKAEMWWRSKRTNLGGNLGFTFGHSAALMPTSFIIYSKSPFHTCQMNDERKVLHSVAPPTTTTLEHSEFCCQGCITASSSQINDKGEAGGGRVHFSNKCHFYLQSADKLCCRCRP